VDLTGNITVHDNRTLPFNINSSGLNVGKNVTGTATYTITQSDLDSGLVINLANATCSFTNSTGTYPVLSNNSIVTVPAVDTPVLTIQKVANLTSYSSLGQVIGYTYTVNNTGNVDILGNITVTDDHINVPFNITSSGLNVGKNVTGTATYTITQADLDSGLVTNSEYATNNNLNSKTVTATVIYEHSINGRDFEPNYGGYGVAFVSVSMYCSEPYCYGSEPSGTTEVLNSDSYGSKVNVSSSKGSKDKLSSSKAKASLSKHKQKHHSKRHKAEKNRSKHHKTEKKIIQCNLDKKELVFISI
jgi:uncharacterized repeat protein (TIGR01451 family)